MIYLNVAETLQGMVNSKITSHKRTKGEFLTIDLVDVEPVKIKSFKDINGRLSNTIKSYMDELNIAVLPLSVTDILPQVTEFRDYDVIHFKGENFACRRDIREDVIELYKDRIIKNLENGVPFYESLWGITKEPHRESSNLEERTVRYLKLTPNEWTLLVSMFRLYDAGVLKEQDDNLILVIGGSNNV